MINLYKVLLKYADKTEKYRKQYFLQEMNIENIIQKGVILVGFGTFRIVKRKARIGRNPQTGEKIRIAAKNVVKFGYCALRETRQTH